MLILENLVHRYTDNAVLRDVSIQLNAGEIGCLLGPSGCGKTTALRLIAGFESLQYGRITLGENIVAQAEQGNVSNHVVPEMRQVGMVFQDYALFPHLTVTENIEFGLNRFSAADKKHRVQEMLELINLQALANKFPHQLSGGQQQRIALARALAPRPHLILMDEPFSNLDVELREKLSLDVRNILKHEGITTLLVTHDQNEAFSIADKIAVMNDGRIQQCDTPYNLYHRPVNRFVADFIGQGTLLTGVVKDAYSVQTELGLLHTAEPLSLDGGSCDADCSKCGKSCAGQTVDLLIRPDDILHDDESPQAAEVVRKAFRGAEFIYTLKLASGALLQVQVPSHHNHRIGEKIGIRPEVDHLVVFAQTVDKK
jgi:iron(III) transport system ATP-binding protein